MIYSNIKVIAQRINPYQYARCYLFSREGGWWEGVGLVTQNSNFCLSKFIPVYIVYIYIFEIKPELKKKKNFVP